MMKGLRIVFTLFGMLAGIVSLSSAADQAVFGPKKYDVKERHGKENRYTDTFAAREGAYLIKLQNGEKPVERSEWIELSVNGEKLLQDDKYGYFFFNDTAYEINRSDWSSDVPVLDARNDEAEAAQRNLHVRTLKGERHRSR